MGIARQNNDIPIGGDLKLDISISPFENINMDGYDFSVELYCSSNKKVTIHKSEMTRINENTYALSLNTSLIGIGNVKARVIAEIPDEYFSDGFRTEVIRIETDYNIIKALLPNNDNRIVNYSSNNTLVANTTILKN